VSGPRVGLLLAVLWAGAPMAITESMVMTESLFTALAVWALVGVLERKWFLATGATVFAGLTRSPAAVVIAVVVVGAAVGAGRAGEGGGKVLRGSGARRVVWWATGAWWLCARAA